MRDRRLLGMAMVAAAAIIGTIGAGKSTPTAFRNAWHTAAVVVGILDSS